MGTARQAISCTSRFSLNMLPLLFLNFLQTGTGKHGFVKLLYYSQLMFTSILQDSELSENKDLQQLIQQIDEEDILHLDEEYTHFESLFPPLDTGMEDK